MSLELRQLRRTLTASPSRPSLTFYPAAQESSFGSRFEDFVRLLQEETGLHVDVRKGKPADVADRPALVLSGRSGHRIAYRAIPEGPEASPFADVLLGLAGLCPEDEAGGPLELKDVDSPASLTVFVAPACPHCPGAVREANRLALSSVLVTTTIVDAQAYPDLAARFGVKSVPYTLLDEGLSFTGIVRAAEIAEKILMRGQESFAHLRFRSLVESGRFSAAVEQLREDGAGRCFSSAWKESTTSSRIGLLLVTEEALGEDPSALDRTLADILPIHCTQDAALRGDTADLIGRIGHPRTQSILEELCSDPHPDVAEIASEALEELKSSGRGGAG